MEYENIIKKKMKKINKYQEISTFLQLVTAQISQRSLCLRKHLIIISSVTIFCYNTFA